jgi:5-(carboxyamino)imidazole ribonucleotide mutase
MMEWGKTARANGISVIIAGAGGAAHLPGMLASVSSLPVIGVPVALSQLDGLDSLLSIVQMPAGIPVATVAIGNSANAALLAIRMLAIEDSALSAQLDDHAAALAETVATKNAALKDSLS